MALYSLDFGELFPEIPEFKDIVLFLPDLRFVSPGTELSPPTDGSATDAVRLPISLLGGDNHLNPGDKITASPNPVHTHVRVTHADNEVPEQTFLFDTGAQLSVISTSIALSLGLDLDNPETSINVFGAGGQTTVPGFTIDALEASRDDDANGTLDGTVRFTNVPIFVLDVADELDGILGMNLFNGAHSLLYDPFHPAHPSLSMSFLTERTVVDLSAEEESALDLLAASYPIFGGSVGGQTVPRFEPDVGSGWQNVVERSDVNNDSRVTAIDVNLIIRDLNLLGPHKLPDLPLRSSTAGNYPDVNGDGRLSAIDALIVINTINFGAETEPPIVAPLLAGIESQFHIGAAPHRTSHIEQANDRTDYKIVSRPGLTQTTTENRRRWLSPQNPREESVARRTPTLESNGSKMAHDLLDDFFAVLDIKITDER
jgi:hypothetical protein